MLKRLLLALSLSTALVSANLQPAQAAPAIGAIGAFFATPLGGVVGKFALSLVASTVGTLIKQFTTPKSPSSASVSGIRGSVAGGGDVPMSFIMGYRMTAGSFAYRGSWGEAGKTPNAFYVEERILSDLPMPNRPVVWVGDKKVTVDWDATPTSRGFPILEGRVDGHDYWWIIYHDGTQTTADPYMRSKFGAHSDHPYTDDMIGRGQAKVIMTFKVKAELIKNSYPKLKFECEGIPLYDISQDSTRGGFGLQRIDDPATWQPSRLLPVHIFNALIGVRYGSDWVWGGQNIEIGRLPASTWIAAIAEARALVDLADGSTEQQYRGGFEITGNMEPQAFVKEALKGCAGRFAEIGGTYKMICGVPPSSVFSFTDRDVIVTRELGFDPYPLLEETHNAIRATYPEPSVGWATKDAPARYTPALEAEDMGRQLATDVSYEMVFSGTQVQRLMKAAIEEARRFRQHGLVLPPEASELEPLDVASWTSASQGYTAKKFIVTGVDDEPTTLAPVQLQEIDPADYDYDADADELPWTVGQLATSAAEPQEVSDWAVAPYTHYSAGGVPRRPGIQMFWDGDQPDVRALVYEVRLAATGDLVLSGEFASSFVTGVGVTPPGSVLPAENYEARSVYDPLSTRAVTWSPWLPVTTPNVKLTADDIDVTFEDLAADVATQVAWIGSSVRDLIYKLDVTGRLVAEQDIANFGTFNQLRRGIQVKLDNLSASFDEVIEVALGPGGAIATALQALYAAMGGNTAQVLIRFEAVAAPAGIAARWALQLSVDGTVFNSAGIYVEVTSGGVSRIVLDASQTVITTNGGTTVQALFNEDGAIIRDLTVGTIRSADGASFWNLTTGAFRVSGGS